METWTIEIESMAGVKQRAKVKAPSLDEAIDIVCRETRVGNVLRAWQGGRRVL